MKTIKQMADEIKIDKQKVYRFIKKNHINEAYQDKGTMYYDDVAESIIKSNFINSINNNKVYKEVENDTVVEEIISLLKKELEVKNQQLEVKDKQISELQKLLDQQQQLTLISNNKILTIKDNILKEKKNIWSKFRGKDKT